MIDDSFPNPYYLTLWSRIMRQQQRSSVEPNIDWFYWDGAENVRNNKQVTHVRVDHTIHKIPDGAFARCTNLQHIELPPGLIQLGSACFEACIALKTIHLPPALEIIDGWAFRGAGLERIHIPSRVTEIRNGVFWGCEFLEHVELHDNITLVGPWGFEGCRALKRLALPRLLTDIGTRAFAECGLEQIEFPASIAHINIGSEAFWDCKQLTSIGFPRFLGKFGDMALIDCPKIDTLRFPTDANPHAPRLTALEIRLLIELCRTDERWSGLNRIGLGFLLGEWDPETLRGGAPRKKDPHSTLTKSCLLSFLVRNANRITAHMPTN